MARWHLWLGFVVFWFLAGLLGGLAGLWSLRVLPGYPFIALAVPVILWVGAFAWLSSLGVERLWKAAAALVLAGFVTPVFVFAGLLADAA